MKIPAKLISAIIFAVFLIVFGFALGKEQDKTKDIQYSGENLSSISLISQNSSAVSVYMDNSEFIAKSGGENIRYSTIQSLIQDLPSGAEVTFIDISVLGDVVIKKDITIRGEITFSDGSLIIESASFLISEGELNFLHGGISASNSILKLNHAKISTNADFGISLYGEKSSFYSFETSVNHNGAYSAILIGDGNAVIQGGVIKSIGEYAVKNEGKLSISGALKIMGRSYSVSTVNSIALSYNDIPFLGDINVVYDGNISRGELIPVFSSYDRDLSKVLVYDANGTPFDVRHGDLFGKSEKDLYIYLPFYVRFYNKGNLLRVDEYLLNENIILPKVNVEEGYYFGGWYSDEALNTPYVNEPLKGDVALYSSVKLMAPVFSISNLTATYDGCDKVIGFDTLTHSLLSQGSLSFDWYKDGKSLLLSGSEISVREVSDSGEYKCIVTFAVGGDIVSAEATFVVNVLPIYVDVPTVLSKEYTGLNQLADINSSPIYDIQNEGGRNVGRYPVVLTLKDSVNYSFYGSREDCVTLYFEITRAQNYFISFDIISDAYTGVAPRYNAKLRFGDVTLLYSKSQNGGFTEVIPSLSGEYWCMAVAHESENYTSASSTPVKITVKEELVVGIRIETPPEKTLYKAFEEVDLTGAVIFATYNSGRVGEISPDDISIKYPSASFLLVGDSSVMLSYSTASVPLAIAVEKASYDVNNIGFCDVSVVYDGTRHTVLNDGAIVGEDGYPLYYRITGGGTEVGVYVVTMIFSSESPNYNLPQPISVNLTIMPRSLIVSYEDLNFVYDGEMKLPKAYATLISGSVVKLSLVGGQVNAGNYVAIAESPSENYVLANPEIEYCIAKATIDLSETFWSEESFIYSGVYNSVTVSGLPNYVTLVGYVGNRAKNAGEYIAEAVLSYDGQNYVLKDKLTHKWKIEKANYDLSKFVFSDTLAEYDGKMHYPTLVGVMPTGFDGITLKYEFSEGGCDVADGKKIVTVKFSTESINYIVPDSVTAYVQITPKQISVVWQGLISVYDGMPKSPTAYSGECEVVVSGEKIDAGKYTAYAVPISTNYTIINDRKEFTIEKAINRWIRIPEISDAYFGKDPIIKGEAAFGDVKIQFYKDILLNEWVDAPIDVGIYYAVATVEESQNYTSLTYNGLSFEIIPVIPTSLSAKLQSPSIKAMTPMGGNDIEISLLYNDGSSETIDFSLVSVEYQNGAIPLFGDKTVKISYGGFSLQLSVNVEKADYDMSGVYWADSKVTYDGNIKYATLMGLPSGVKVVKYISNSGTNAGEYPLYAEIDYDEYNYNEPKIPDGILVIERKVIELPRGETFIYDGDTHRQTILEDPLYSAVSREGKDAGIYSVIFTLKDPDNYTFDDDDGIIYFEIAKRPVTLRVERGGKSFSVESGDIIADDELSVSYYTKDGKVYLDVDNDNYSVTVIPYNRAAAFAFGAVISLLCLFIICLFAVFGVYMFGRLRAKPIAVNVAGDEAFEGIEKHLLAVDRQEADAMITDCLAKSLVKHSRDRVATGGNVKTEIPIGIISAAFSQKSVIDINSLKEKGIIPDTVYKVKITSDGIIDKPLTVIANGFSLSAVKMIALTGGEAVRCKTVKAKAESLKHKSS